MADRFGSRGAMRSLQLSAAPLRPLARGSPRRCVTRAASEAVGTGMNKYSARITQPKSQGASQAMLYATGLKEADMNKAQARPRGAHVGTARHHPLCCQ